MSLFLIGGIMHFTKPGLHKVPVGQHCGHKVASNPRFPFWILSRSFGEKSDLSPKLQDKIQNRKPGFEASHKALDCSRPSYDKLLLHCKRGIVITTECLLFQIQMSEQNTLLCGGQLPDNLFLILRQLSSHDHTILAINCVHA